MESQDDVFAQNEPNDIDQIFGSSSSTTPVDSSTDEETLTAIFGNEKPAPITPTPEDKKVDKSKSKKDEVPVDEDDETPETNEDKLNEVLGENKPDKTKAVTEDSDDEDEDEEEDEESEFEVLTKELVSLGIFSQTDEDAEEEPVKTAEQFAAKWQKEKNQQVHAQIYNFLKSEHGDEGIEVFNAIFVKGVAPQDYFQKYTSLEAVSEMDPTSEDGQKAIFRAYYKRQGMADEAIEKRLQKAITNGEIEDDAKDFHPTLIKQEQQELEQMEQRAEREKYKRLQAEQKYVHDLTNVMRTNLKEKTVDGLPFTDKVAQDSYDYMVTKKYTLGNQHITEFQKDLIQFFNGEPDLNAQLKLALILKGGLDLSKVKQDAVSKETNKAFQSLKRKEKQQKRTSKTNPDDLAFLQGL